MSWYRCWAPDEGENEADGKNINTSDGSGAREAAEIFASVKFPHNPFPAIEVCVRDGHSVRLFVVDVATEPSFVATEMKTSSAGDA